MTSPIRGASSSNYHHFQPTSPESSPPKQSPSPGLPRSSELGPLQRMNASRRSAGQVFNVRFSDQEPTVHEVPRYDEGRQADIVVRDDAAISMKAGKLWAEHPNGLPGDVKKSTRKDPKLYAAYKDFKKNNGYKG
ncbi:hypothetical protein XarbCFBP6827_12565 [Xanthomonas arboricola]|nr:hypothetical protein XarbCFBP6827_12565 [Xanthomonas arboricola]